MDVETSSTMDRQETSPPSQGVNPDLEMYEDISGQFTAGEKAISCKNTLNTLKSNIEHHSLVTLQQATTVFGNAQKPEQYLADSFVESNNYLSTLDHSQDTGNSLKTYSSDEMNPSFYSTKSVCINTHSNKKDSTASSNTDHCSLHVMRGLAAESADSETPSKSSVEFDNKSFSTSAGEFASEIPSISAGEVDSEIPSTNKANKITLPTNAGEVDSETLDTYVGEVVSKTLAMCASEVLSETPATCIGEVVSETAATYEVEVGSKTPATCEVVSETLDTYVGEVVSETLAMCASEVVSETPATCVDEVVSETLDTYVGEIVSKTLAMCASEVVSETPATCVGEVVSETSAIYIGEVVSETPATCVAEVVSETPAKCASEVVSETPATCASEVVSETPATCVGEVSETPATCASEVVSKTLAACVGEVVSKTPTTCESEIVSETPAACVGDVVRETFYTSTCEVESEGRILQSSEVSLQQAERDSTHEEHSVFRLKSIPKKPEITPVKLPGRKKHKIDDIEDTLQELGADCTNDDNQSKSEEDLIGGFETHSKDVSQNHDHSMKTKIDESQSQISNQDQSNHEAEDDRTVKCSEMSDIKEEGAVGGSEDENIQGILQKTSSDHREKTSSSVQFNDEVRVETFSQTDPSSSCTTKATLAHGDGPSPIASLRLSGDTLSNDSCFEPAVFSCRLPRIGSNTIHNRSECQLQLFAPEPKREEPVLKRTDSIPKVLSPTNLLHRKQKALAASRMNSNMPAIIPGNSHAQTPERTNALEPKKLNMQPEKPDTSEVTGKLKSLGSDDLPSLLNSNKTMSESNKSKVDTDRESDLTSSDLSLKDCTKTDKKSSDRSFILSGYDIAEYMIEGAEVEVETTGDESNKEHLNFPTLSELQQKILEESFQDYLTNSAACKNTGQASAKEKADVVGNINFDQSYTSPSKIHQKIIQRETAEINTPGLGAFSYTSPSKLHQKVCERERGEINTPGLGAFSYSSPSKLHQKVCERERGEINTPGLGAFSYTSPSKLHQKVCERERGEINTPGLGAFSYTSPSKLHQKVCERERGEINTPGLGAFSYISPSKLHQKVCERERGEINTPGLGAFSYMSPSKLHQKINERERADIKSPGLGAFSYTTPSELFRTRKEEDDRTVLTSKETAPCNQVIETDSTEKEKFMDDQTGKISLTLDDIFEGVDSPEGRELLKAELKEIEYIKEKAKHWRKRCKRKERLDNLCRRAQEHSQSDISLQNVLSNESSCSCVSSKNDLNTEFENETIASNNSDVQQKKENNVPNTNILRLDSRTYHEQCQLYVHSILTNFLQYIREKQIKDISFTDDDYKHLMLIQALIAEVSKQNKEARTEDDQLTGDEANGAFLQLKDSIMLKKLQCQLEKARNMQRRACDSMTNVDSKDDLNTRSVDSVSSGYLGETESSETNTVSLDHFTAPHPVYRKLYKSFSEDFGCSADVNMSDSGTTKTEESFAGFSTESLKGSISDPDSWLCICDQCMQRKPSERQVLSRSTSLIEAELMHMLKQNGLIWQRSIEADANKIDESKVTKEKNKIGELEEKTLQTLRIEKSMDEKEKSGNEKITDSDRPVEVDTPSTKSEQSYLECSPRLIKMLTCLEYPKDAGEVEFNIGPSYVRLDKEGWSSVADETDMTDESEQNLSLMEGSPDRGQRLFGSSQNLDRRDGGGGKRKQASRSMTPDSRYMLDKEVTESQNRKLQTEIATLQTENKLLKEKYNRAQAKISDLETQLADAQDDLSNLQESLNQEVSDLSTRTKKEISRDRDSLEAKILALTKQNEALKLENSSLEKKLESSHRATDMARHNSEKSKTLEAHKSEITSLKEELNRVKALLEQSERHLREEEERHSVAGREILKLTELKNALQQQSDSGGSAMYTDKQLKSLEKRLKVTEDRLHQERADRANNLSAVEDKLLTENAKLQASEKELSRQLHREKEKNRNFEQRVKQIREENEKLRLAMPFDDATLLSNKGNYDIPYSSHSNQRAETMKHISDDMNYILSQIEKQDGLQSRDDEEIIRTLWNKRELAYRQLQEYDVQFQELHINDHNITDGLKNLRDTYGQAESKLRNMEEQVEDARAQVSTLDATYQEQLGVLVKERHEAFARLKTAEDLLAALRAENEVLHRTMAVSHTTGGPRQPGDHSGKSVEALHVELTNLESKVSQLTRNNQLMEVELNTLRVQLVAREKALKDVQTELDLAYNRLKGDDSEDRKQEKIDQLSSQVSGLQVELQMLTDKYNHACSDNKTLESEISTLRKQAGTQKTKQLRSEHSDSKVLQQLRDDIEEKDCRLTSLSKQLDGLENQLQKTRQDLYIEQMHSSELESENENLQQTVAQRAQMFEALSGSEREQLAQYQILKDTLDNVSQELAQKHAQIISLDVNLSGARDKCAELEEEVRRLRKAHGGEEEGQEAFTEDEQSSAHQLKIKELEKERAMLKQELEQAYSAIQASEEQYRTLQTESAQLEQELVKEKTVILQLTAEKGEVEQHLEELAEEHESLIQEKTQAEEDLIKLETKLQEILQKYENQARKQHGNLEQEYPGLPPEARKLITELESLTLILEGKEKEIDMLKDRMNRQNIEIDFLHHKVELVHNDSIANREDVARMISELTLKMKEAVSTREVNQFLVGERTKLQNEKSHLEKELDIERKNTDERRKEIQEVIRKIERTETSQKSTEKDSRNKDNVIISLESELRNAKQNLASMETEIIQLRSKVDHLNEDLKNLTGINSSLEKRLEMEQNSLSVEKSEVSRWKEEFNTLSHDFQVLEHQHSVLNDKYQAELHNNEKLKRDLEVKEEENTTLKDDLSNAKVELDSNKGQLLITKDTVQKLTQDKGNIYQDYEGMCRSLTEKERQLTELRERTDEKIEHLNKEHTQERVRLEQDRVAAIQERDAARKEMDNINEQLRQKEIQLNTFGKTLQELESVTREKKQLEAHVHKLESSTGDSKVLLDGQRKELMALNEALAKQQERSTRLEAENHTLQGDLKALKESGNREARELNITINELKSQHENERHYLNDNLSQTQIRLRSVEASLSAAASDRDSLQAKARLLENTVEELHSKLSDETTGRRLAEQSVGTLRLQLEDMKNDKNVAEARFVEMKNQVTKAEEKLKREEEKCQGLSTQFQELNAISTTNRTNVKAKLEQIEMLQKEISNLKQMIETQKQTLNGKMKKSTLEFKQQIENAEEERDKLQMLNQQLSSDLDSCREHVASKNKENLKLQEEILVLEDSVRECKVKQKHAEDTLRVETDKQAELNARFEAQEEELKRLRNFLTKKVEQSGDSDKTMWHEMNRVIQELSRQMTSHLDSTRGGDKDKSPESLVSRLKKQLAEAQGELSTERSLHHITKTSLQALEEDCQRLRKQLHHYRRRDPPSGEKKHKNRMEAINAIIARSQSQAHALLASGGYFDDSMASPRVRSHQTSPKVGFHSPRHAESPDNSYSEDLSIASLPAMHYSQPSKKS